MTGFWGWRERTDNSKNKWRPGRLLPTLRDETAKDGAPVGFWLVRNYNSRDKCGDPSPFGYAQGRDDDGVGEGRCLMTPSILTVV